MGNTGKSLLTYRKWLAVFLAAVLGILCLPVTASAAEPTAVSISAPSQPVDSGQQFTITIEVAPGTPIAGMQFDLSYDPSLVAVENVQEGNLLGQGGANSFFNSGKIDDQAGTITGVFGAITTPGEAVSTRGTFATITLTAKAQRDRWPLGLSNVMVGDMDGNAVPVTFSSYDASPSAPEDSPTFSWWVLSVIVGVAFALIAATIAGVLLRRRQMVRAAQSAGRQGRGA